MVWVNPVSASYLSNSTSVCQYSIPFYDKISAVAIFLTLCMILCVFCTLLCMFGLYVTALLPFGVINDDMSISIK